MTVDASLDGDLVPFDAGNPAEGGTVAAADPVGSPVSSSGCGCRVVEATGCMRTSCAALLLALFALGARRGLKK